MVSVHFIISLAVVKPQGAIHNNFPILVSPSSFNKVEHLSDIPPNIT